MTLSETFKKDLRRKAHALHPIVLLGQKGLTDAVNIEIERGLIDHELIKIKMNSGERNERKTMIQTICEKHTTELIQLIGRTAIIYRKNEETP